MNLLPPIPEQLEWPLAVASIALGLTALIIALLVALS